MKIGWLMLFAALMAIGCTQLPVQNVEQSSQAHLLEASNDAAASPTVPPWVITDSQGRVIGVRPTPVPSGRIKDARGRVIVTTPTITAAQAEAIARREVGGTVDSATAQLTTFQWIEDNVGIMPGNYSPDSVCWLVTLNGSLNTESGIAYGPFIKAKVPITADTGERNGIVMCGGNCDAPVVTGPQPTPLTPPPSLIHQTATPGPQSL